MTYRKLLVLAVSILLVFSALFVGVITRKGDAVAHTGSHSDVPSYAPRGPHPIGIRDLVIDGETLLEITVWYPALRGENLEETISNPYEIKMGDPFGTVAIASFVGLAMHDAPYDLSTGSYPLVILSPGFSIGASAYAWLAEHLASYGFVVIAPEHHEFLDPGNELWQATIRRPQDILIVLAFVDEQVGSGGAFAGLINPDLVAVIGHSYGGYTSLAAGGGQLETESFKANCETAYETNGPIVWLCDQLLPHMADMARLAGLDSVPDGLWPAWADPHVDAIVPMAGDAFFLGQAGLAEISVPVMAIGGTQDDDSPFMWGTHPSYEYASSSTKVKIALNGAEHMIFTGPCEKVPWFLKFFSNEFCSDTGWDRIYAHDLINHFTMAFLLAELKQDKDAAAALVPEAVEFPGVTYEAQGY